MCNKLGIQMKIISYNYDICEQLIMKFSLMRTFEGSNKYVVHSTVIIFMHLLKKVASIFSLLWLCPLS